MEFRTGTGCYNPLGAGAVGFGLNYEQRSCLVCNAPYFCNRNLSQSRAHAHSASDSRSQEQQAHIDKWPSPTQAFCKLFQIDDEAPTVTTTRTRNNGDGDPERESRPGEEPASASDPFCHSCSLQVRNLQQLQKQCELIQAQILEIRDDMGYRLISAFSAANLADPNYALKLKVFQKWAFKYLPQRSGDINNGERNPSLHCPDQQYQHSQSQPRPPPNSNVSGPTPQNHHQSTYQHLTHPSTPERGAFDDEHNSIFSLSESQKSQSRSVSDFDDGNGDKLYAVTPSKTTKRWKKTSESKGKRETDDIGGGGDLEQCFICGKMLTNDYLRKNHMQTHSDLRPYKCSMCDKSFANANYKKMHEKTHDKSRLQGEPKFSCSKCGRKYHLQKGLYKHTRYSPTCGTTTLVDHGKVRCQCELCGREFNSRYRLGVHVRGFHKKLRPVSCTICGRPCVDNQQRKKHELTHNPSPSKRFLLRCIDCPLDAPREFDRKQDLEKHYASEHPQAEVPNIRRPTRHPRKFRCEICPESRTRPSRRNGRSNITRKDFTLRARL